LRSIDRVMEAVMISSGSVGRSIWAVVAGIVVGVVLTTITDVVLHAMGVFPAWGQPVSDGPLELATAYRIVFGVLGCYVAARLAPDRPMRHAMIAGFIGFIVSIAGAVVTWNKGPAFGPHWYPLALIVTALPCAWVGGWMRERQLRG
jgi:peptidoglycan/LPS O-acetylase OafA/YrhL